MYCASSDWVIARLSSSAFSSNASLANAAALLAAYPVFSCSLREAIVSSACCDFFAVSQLIPSSICLYKGAFSALYFSSIALPSSLSRIALRTCLGPASGPNSALVFCSNTSRSAAYCALTFANSFDAALLSSFCTTLGPSLILDAELSVVLIVLLISAMLMPLPSLDAIMPRNASNGTIASGAPFSPTVTVVPVSVPGTMPPSAFLGASRRSTIGSLTPLYPGALGSAFFLVLRYLSIFFFPSSWACLPVVAVPVPINKVLNTLIASGLLPSSSLANLKFLAIPSACIIPLALASFNVRDNLLPSSLSNISFPNSSFCPDATPLP